MASESVMPPDAPGKPVALVRYDAACRALAEAKAVDEVKDLRDKADAMRAYARQAKNKQLEVDAAEIRIRAERRLGELIAAQKATIGLNPGAAGAPGPGRGNKNVVPQQNRVLPPTLAEAGIDKKLSSRAQKLAAVPEEMFEASIAEWRERVEQENERVTTKLLDEGKKAQRDAELAAQREAILRGQVSAGQGPYDVIVLDPPWPYGTKYDPAGRRAANPYPEMSLDEIAIDGEREVVRKAADDCILWLWTTHRFMRASFPLLDRWGFEEKAIVTWVKDRMGLGSWLRSQSEFVIMAVRGSPRVNLTNQTTVIHGPLREHSRKPDEFYLLAESLSPDARYYDRFAREARAGWDVGGNDPEKFGSAA